MICIHPDSLYIFGDDTPGAKCSKIYLTFLTVYSMLRSVFLCCSLLMKVTLRPCLQIPSKYNNVIDFSFIVLFAVVERVKIEKTKLKKERFLDIVD